MEIGEVIARGRKAAGMKQKELAAAAGLHVQTLKRLESGAGSGYRTVRALQKALEKNGVTWVETPEGFDMRVVLRVPGRHRAAAEEAAAEQAAAEQAAE
jgi:transcriptional regulator with XRE-family HTH domain